MITPGTILIERGTLLPMSLRLENPSTTGDWAPLTDNLESHELEKELSTAGWTFCYMAGAISATAFGFERHGMIRAALKRLIADVRLKKCNCMEIEDIATRSFLGVPYVSISAHSRHIQRGPAFSA